MTNNIILYENEARKIKVDVRFEDETFWLTQKAMAELFQTTPQNITIHLKNIFSEGELDENSTCKDFLQVQQEGARAVNRNQKFYNLDAVIAAGYRVNSKQAAEQKKTEQFFSSVQNKLLFAVIQKTAAEIIVNRAKADLPNMGLTTWKGSRVRKEDIFIAKNYLTEDEIDTLNRMVALFLDTAELRVKDQIPLSMRFWEEEADNVIQFSRKPLLNNIGSISHEEMKKIATKQYENFDSERKKIEAQAADLEDQKAIKQLIQKSKKK